ncbi:hypothetical protein Tsubulata_050805 [Turnera subulata]|uniref:DUF4219 domain-containing protein n=1 Tax=Turnera subulata TaxID=218843 RepID=A0A9Q0J857_9ROSI|nr:hypothetical protein Tsubulata_050805 [Turnera subulata]
MDPTALPQYHIPINYQDWSIHMKTYLINQDVWCRIVELVFPNYDEANDFSSGDEPNNGNDQSMMDYYKTWRDKNSRALRAIQDACAPNIPPQIAGLTSAKLAWETLAKLDKFKQRGIPLTDPRYSNPVLDVNFGDYISETAADPPTTWDFQPRFGTSLLFYKPKGYETLISAIRKGDWGVISGFIQSDPKILASIISYDGNTPIHEAAAACQTEIARRMVQEMSEQDLGIQSSDGYTPLHLAASFGSIAIARFLVQKNKKLVQIRNVKGLVPVTMASILGKKDTTLYLYNSTPIELLYPESGDSGFLLLEFCIANRMLGK